MPVNNVPSSHNINKPVWDPEKLLILIGVKKQSWRPGCGLCSYPGKIPPNPPPRLRLIYPHWPVPSFTASLSYSIHPSISPHPNPASLLHKAATTSTNGQCHATRNNRKTSTNVCFVAVRCQFSCLIIGTRTVDAGYRRWNGVAGVYPPRHVLAHWQVNWCNLTCNVVSKSVWLTRCLSFFGHDSPLFPGFPVVHTFSLKFGHIVRTR